MGSSANRQMRSLRGVIAVGALVAMTACVPQIRNHGYVPFEEDLAMITVGVDTRESVTTVAGPPTAGGVLGQDTFYYVASKFRRIGGFAPQEISREVLAISFDAAGVVSNIERFTLADGQVVVLSRRVTDDGIRDTTFIKQLLGSFGRVDAGTFLGDQG